MSGGSQPEKRAAGDDERFRAAGRLLHLLDRQATRPGPFIEGSQFRDVVDRQLTDAARTAGDDPATYREAFIELANQHGWNLAPDGSNWDERWREIQAAGRRRARIEEIRDALEDLD